MHFCKVWSIHFIKYKLPNTCTITCIGITYRKLFYCISETQFHSHGSYKKLSSKQLYLICPSPLLSYIQCYSVCLFLCAEQVYIISYQELPGTDCSGSPTRDKVRGSKVWLPFSFYELLKQKYMYRKFPKYSNTQKICCDHSKIWTMWLYHRVMSPKDADEMANSVDPDQTASLGAVWSGSALFAQAYLSENLGSLR